MVNEKLFFAAKLYPLHATTNSSSGVKDIKKMSKYFEFLENNKYLDMSFMGVGTNVLGYANSKIDNKVIKSIKVLTEDKTGIK